MSFTDPLLDHMPAPAAAVAELGTILGVWAHPDDEAYLTAGLMAIARDNGQRVVVVHATLGEAGTGDSVAYPPDRMRSIRQRELVRSLATVGVTERRLLGHRDGGCQDVADDAGADQIVDLIEAVAPDTIVTFGPDGLTGHPDHRAVSRWTTAAWEATRQQSRLLHATVTDDWVDRHREVNERVGAFDPGYPAPIRLVDAALALDLPADVLDRKLSALRAHRSQTSALEAVLGPETYRGWWSTEVFAEV